MDNVQFPKKGGSWLNRVQIIINGKAAWLTVPVVRAFHGVRLVNETQFDDSTPWQQNILKTIQLNYSRTPYFEEIFPHFKVLINNPSNHLTEYNIFSIRYILDLLSIDKNKLILGSSLAAKGKATDLLISMVKSAGGTAYLCGGGAQGYQDDKMFLDAGVELIYQNFKHPVYTQVNSKIFIPGLSIIDALMNNGIAGTNNLFKSSTNY